MRIKGVDGLRGLAALMIVFYHYFWHWDKATPLASWLFVAVPMFFVISGYVISLTIERCKSPKDFIWNRMTRLLPAFWVCCTLTYAVVSYFGLEGREVSFQDYLINMTMLHEFAGVPHVDGVYWTLTIELVFYGMMLILFALGLFKYAFWVVAGIALAANLAGMDSMLSKWLPFFAMGIGIYKWLDISWIDKTPLASPGLVWFGSISYALYLIHQNIGYVIIEKMGIAGAPIAIALSVAIAAVVTYKIERPVLRGLR